MVLIIVAILVVAAWLAMQSAKVASRNEAMKTAASTIDQAVSTFSRMYPPVGSQPDALLPPARGANPWRASSTQGLFDETGEPLLGEWPSNPFDRSQSVEVYRYATAASCATGQPGQVKVCRLDPVADGRLAYLIRAWGKDSNGAPTQVYSVRHGGV